MALAIHWHPVLLHPSEAVFKGRKLLCQEVSFRRRCCMTEPAWAAKPERFYQGLNPASRHPAALPEAAEAR